MTTAPQHRTLPASPVVAKRDLKSATAKFATVLAAFGLAGSGLAASGAQDYQRPELRTEDLQVRTDELRNRAVMPGDNVSAVSPQLRRLLDTAIETGSAREALERAGDVELTGEQREALLSVSEREWAALREVRGRLQPLQPLADCHGSCGGFIY